MSLCLTYTEQTSMIITQMLVMGGNRTHRSAEGRAATKL